MESQRAHVERLKQQQREEAAQQTSDQGCSHMSAADGETISAEEAEQLWLREMEAKYGEGTYQLFRPLYKDLCDEMRREYFTKPPPPILVEQPTKAARAAPNTPHQKSQEMVGEERVEAQAPPATFVSTDETSSPHQVTWSVVYQPANNCVVFRRDAVPSLRQGRVVAYSKVVVADPPKLNSLLTFADWCPIEVMIERRGVIMHLSVACNEGGMHMRNVRMYRSPKENDRCSEADATGVESDAHGEQGGSVNAASTDGDVVNEEEEGKGSKFRRKQELSPQQLQQHPTPANILDATDDAEWCRQNLCYDGPCLWHLELDFLNELYDVMQDHGITLDWIRWAAEWVSYLEHVNYTRWSVGVLEELVPSSQRGPENDFLTEGEREALDEPAEDWLSARAI